MAFQPYDPEASAAQHRRKVMALSLIGLAVFLGWEALRVRQFIARDTRPPSWDQAIHLEIALDYRQALRQGSWKDILHPAPKPGMPAFPPLYHLALGPIYDAADPAAAALWINYFYLIVLTFSVFGLVFEFRPDFGAAAAALAFVCAPAVQELLYTQLVDLPVAACSAAAYWALIRSERLTRWAPSLAFGVLFAVGMLHKWSFFSYMIPAYYLGFKALSRPGARGPALGAAGVGVALFAPWYAANWPLLMPRLVQASSDFSVPVWHGGVFFSYLITSFSALGPLLWVMGWIGLLVPHHRRRAGDGWLIALWTATSYVFWAIVPNRQFRFLTPGLPGLAVAACGCWPAPLIWSLIPFQLFLAANFTGGWIGPITIPLPLAPLGLFPNNPPAEEQWHIDDILKEAQRRHDPAEPLGNLTLVANAERFNGPNFTWRRKVLGLSHVRIRGVNKRLCEFSEFVVLKDGKLGPASVIDGLKEAAMVLRARRGWFSRSYDEVAQWPLPDGTRAVLFQRGRPKTPPLKTRHPVKFLVYNSGALSAEHFTIDLGAFDPGAGVYPAAKIASRSAELRGLKIADLAVELQGLQVVSASESADEFEELRFLKLKRLRLTGAKITAAALKGFLEERVKGLSLGSLTIDRTIKASGSFRTIPLQLEIGLALEQAPRALRLNILALKVGATALPLGAINRIKELTVSLEANPETPFLIDLPGLTLRDGALSIP